MDTAKSPRPPSNVLDQAQSKDISVDDKTAAFTKIKSSKTPEAHGGNQLTSKSPHRENGRHVLIHSPGSKGSKRRSNQELGDTESPKHSGSAKNDQVKEQKPSRRKRSLDESEEGLDKDIAIKRRRLSSLEKQLSINTVPGQMAEFLELTQKHIKRASRRFLEADSVVESSNTAYQTEAELFKECATVNGSLVNKVSSHSTVTQADKNIDELLSRKLKEAGCDTSPFKTGSKMSAFEISLLKGKQSVERRRSLEAATLRSSPRMNQNVPARNYSDTKRYKSSLSVKTSSDADCSDEGFKTGMPGDHKQTGVKKRKKRRHSEQTSALSPSSIENNCFVGKARGTILRKNSCSSPGKESSDSGKGDKSGGVEKASSFSYRLNGSPELKGLPSVLSLNSLSGIPKKVQGSSFSSLYRGYCANGLSGKPPALSSKPCLLDLEPAEATKPSLRPDSLSVAKETNHHHILGTNDDFQQSPAKEADKLTNISKVSNAPASQNKQTRKKMTLADTVSMLHKTSRAKSVNELGPTTNTSPSKSDDGSHVSRRSSRSSTPNISPIKSEILTPNSTPCTTPSKSPPSPARVVASPRGSKKKSYLFCKHDEVLARWHDGLFYLGTILKIAEKKEKCLLRYEDSSEYWSTFKDIHRVAKEEEEICCLCLGGLSEAPNEIVICDHCSQGYHQECHTPHINGQEIIDPDAEWYCRNCVFMMTIKYQGAVKQGNPADELRKMKMSLPYDINLLTWDAQHKSNVEQCYCYCGGPGIWYQKMLQCCRCKQWFHEACLQCTEFPLLYGDSFYIFVCSPCNSGDEYVKRLDVEWPDVVHIALFNLVMDIRSRKYCHLEDELLPWIDGNWAALQLPQYATLSQEEKKESIKDALHDNRARFVCAAEMRRNCNLWGLRIRVCPPRIHITLPIKEKVTDDVMKSLKIKGRRSKVFIPVECKSPVTQLQHSPLHRINRKVCKRLGTFIYKEDGTTSPAQNPNQGTTVRKPKVKVPLLDRLIPHQVSFIGHNHPFKTELEQESEKNDLSARGKIWQSFDVMPSVSQNQEGDPDTVTDGPPILEKVEPIHQSSDHTPPMPVIQEKKQRRKSVAGSGKLKQKKNASESEEQDGRASRRSSRKLIAPPNITESQTLKEVVTVKRFQSIEKNCFAGYISSVGYGHFFFTNGKRRNSDGSLEYLITWEN